MIDTKKIQYFLGASALLLTSCSSVNKRSLASLNPPQTCLEIAESLMNLASKRPSEQALSNLYSVVAQRKGKTAHANIASVYEMHLSKEAPRRVKKPNSLSPGLASADFEEARELGGVFEDYKVLSDAKPLALSKEEVSEIKALAKDHALSLGLTEGSDDFRRAYLKELISKSYSFEKDLSPSASLDAKAKWKISVSRGDLNTHHEEAFDYVENYWKNLVKETPEETNGSVIPLPYEFVVANDSRFDEMYYWDTYFGMQGLLSTGRLDLSQKIVENFLYMIREYGLIPNGTRDYYLTRSQPPFVSSMVKEVYEATLKSSKFSQKKTKKWLAERAYPLLKADFEDFWMKPGARFDPQTNLHHHFDDVNHARPERHSADKELADDWNDDHGLGITYDVTPRLGPRQIIQSQCSSSLPHS